MRQIYTSQRMENVERVVALLGEAGIQTSVTNRKVYHTANYTRFSYSARSDADSWPKVWVVNANDQTQARQLLRDAGIEPAVRYADELAISRGNSASGSNGGAMGVAWRARIAVMALLALALLVYFIRAL